MDPLRSSRIPIARYGDELALIRRWCRRVSLLEGGCARSWLVQVSFQRRVWRLGSRRTDRRNGMNPMTVGIC